ncbi:DUF2935 domain-containing protein [Paenisporosarcina sp. TG-14]|uniref:DUF2935 domain-containing protein n=1 Tax=Paenisporosarcina sp. TG-14 TaxID=1231057 RepID=UPI0002E94901|nr:DUF2935 domain-containing protein [Paenisporosarcina sp. TG-14]
MTKIIVDESLIELHFWLQILGDHSRFIHDSLAPSEEKYINGANSFTKRFDKLLHNSKQVLDEQSLVSLLEKAKILSEEIRAFKLDLIKEHLVGKIKISLSPSFINHMVNEVEEAIRIFSYLEKGQMPPVVHSLHHDLLWLLDAAGHAGAIDVNLDQAEKQLKYKGRKFTKDWEEFYLKAVELAGYLRTNIIEFPALAKFHNDIQMEMIIFKTFLRELEEMELKKETLGTLAPLMADHMAREECYYLKKLAETTALSPPTCDPTKPRTEV